MPSSDSRYAPTAWGTSVFEDLTMPSGQLAQVRRPGIQQLISAGVLDSADTLSTLVDQKHIKRVKGKPAGIDASSLLKDPKNMLSVLELVDKVVAHMVVKPEVQRPVTPNLESPKDGAPKDEASNPHTRALRDEERDPEVVYTDQIDMVDRMFIFSYAVGGSTDVERFRSGLDQAMGSMADSEGVPLPAV